MYTPRHLAQTPPTRLANPCEETTSIGETYELRRSMVGVSSNSWSAIQRIQRW